MSGLKATPDDVRHAYRLLLGREPDPSGFQTYCELIEKQSVSAADLAAILQASEEYKTRHATEPVLVETDFNGLKLYPWRGDSLIGGPVQAGHAYEPYVLPAFVDSVPVGGVVLDIGANIGMFTLSAARKVGPKGQVFAIEPIARNVQSLCAGVHGNGFENVSVFPVAASASSGVVPMLRNANSSNGIVDKNVPVAMADAFAPTQPVQQLLQGTDRLDVIKIDIEGHEPLAWPGIDGLVRKHRPVIFTEFNPVAIRNHSRVDAEVYLRQLFSHAQTIETIEFDGERHVCRSVEDVMDRWRAVNRRAGLNGTCHLDLRMATR
jgi:FkbM family methyltransferase